MKGQLDASTPESYFAALDANRRAEISALDLLIREHAPDLTPCIHAGMLGYGRFRYRYASGRTGESCRLSIASNASYISLYVLAADAQGYLAERYVERLPTAKIGKSCVRFKRTSDLDRDALVELIGAAAQMPYGENETAL